jgi:HD-like signal output (HDOD) protein
VLLEQTLGSLIFTGAGGLRRMIDQVWAHMVRTAPIARGLAPAFDVEPEHAFALALLHDVGKLAIFDRMASVRTAHRSDVLLDPVTVSRTLRLLHEPLGGLCALGWQFGGEAAVAIASHHRQPPPEFPDPLTEVLWLAERVDLAAIQGRPLDLDALWREGALSGDPTAASLLLPELVPPGTNAAV